MKGNGLSCAVTAKTVVTLCMFAHRPGHSDMVMDISGALTPQALGREREIDRPRLRWVR